MPDGYRIATRDSYEARQRELRDERRAEFFAERDDIPDLEFLTPDCSVCGRYTEFDDGWFSCPECLIAWPRSGYGHQAVRDTS